MATPKRQLHTQNTCYRMYRSLRLGHPLFVQLALLSNPQNPTLYNALQSARYSTSAPSCGGIYTLSYNVPWTQPTQHPNMHLNWFNLAVFAQLAAESPYTSQCALKCD